MQTIVTDCLVIGSGSAGSVYAHQASHAGLDVTLLSGRPDLSAGNSAYAQGGIVLEEVDADLWDEIFAINVRGVILCTKHAVPLLKRSRGAVINMASVTGWRADPKQIGYSASKHAVIGITEACAQDLGRHGIRVNALCPGPVVTEALLSRIAKRVAGTSRTVEDSLAEDFAPMIALGQVTTPEEVADGALFLASDASRGVSALQLRIDGGNMSWPAKPE